MVRPTWYGPGDTLWENHRASCELNIFHCHVADQIYYSEDEYLAVYPDGQLPQVSAADMERIKDWIQVGFASGGPILTAPVGTPAPGSRRASDHSSGRAWDINSPNPHTQHVHTSFSPVRQPEVRPGDIVTVHKDGKIVKAGSGDPVAGIVTQIDYKHNGPTAVRIAEDVNKWLEDHTHKLSD